jgi:hypothetical protein
MGVYTVASIFPDDDLNAFRADLAYGNDSTDEAFWGRFYRSVFPTLTGISGIEQDLALQRLGIDRKITLPEQVVYVDEKKRRGTWPDILLEVVSNDNYARNDPRRKGWILKDLAIDYLAYAFMDTGTVHLFPWLLLQRAFRVNMASWREYMLQERGGFRRVIARNHTHDGIFLYNTISMAVPTAVLLASLSEVSYIAAKREG